MNRSDNSSAANRAGVTSIRFSTAQHAAEERFEAFRIRINTMFDMYADAQVVKHDFGGRIVSAHTGSMLISAMETQHFEYGRSRRRILNDHLDHILLRVDLTDAWDRGGRPHSLMIIDLGQPLEQDGIAAHNISLVLPRRALAEAGLFADQLHGQALTTPSALFLADHLTALMRHADGIEPTVVAHLAGITPALVAACLKPSQEKVLLARREFELLVIERARNLIRDNLYNDRLNPTFLQERLAVSRATLYRLFEPMGGVAATIRQARLRQSLRDIAGMAPGARLADIGHALGFSSEAHFSRAFKDHFGCTPKEARGLVSVDIPVLATGSLEDPIRRFPEWLQGL